MAFYYVKSGGTATGDAGIAAIERTGSFSSMGASAYYDNIKDVLNKLVPTTDIAAGDYVYVASDHSHDYGSTNPSFSDVDCVVVSVDTNNADTELAGAFEKVSLSSFSCGSALFKSMKLETRDSMGGNHENGILDTGRIGTSSYGFSGNTKDCEVILSDSSQYLGRGTSRGRCNTYDNISLHTSSVIPTVSLFHIYSGILKVLNCDLSSYSLSGPLFYTTANTGADGPLRVFIDRCKLPSSVTLHNTLTYYMDEFILTSCDAGSGYHYFYYANYYGSVGEDTSIYRDATYDGINGYSAEAVSNSNAVPAKPFRFEVCSIPINVSDYSGTITFTVHFAVDGSSTALNNDELYFGVEYPDGQSQALGVCMDNKEIIASDAVSPTTETGLWTGLSGTNKQMSINMTATIGTAQGNIGTGVVRVFASLAKPSTTVYIDPKVDIT